MLTGLHGQASREDDCGKEQVGEAVDRHTDQKQTAITGFQSEPARHLIACVV